MPVTMAMPTAATTQQVIGPRCPGGKIESIWNIPVKKYVFAQLIKFVSVICNMRTRYNHTEEVPMEIFKDQVHLTILLKQVPLRIL